MSIWAIADLHLSFGTPQKTMTVFGEKWKNYEEKIAKHWKELISPHDLVIIAGDTSWALKQEQVIPDLEWVHNLPGTKVMIRGNHDYWWSSLTKMKSFFPPSIIPIHNSSFSWNDVSITGTRLWDSPEYSFHELIDFRENPHATQKHSDDEKLFKREMERLERAIDLLDPHAPCKIVMTHYPPISWKLNPSKASLLLEKGKVDYCIFGHLHQLKENLPPLFGKKNGVDYRLTSCDYLDFCPMRIR